MLAIDIINLINNKNSKYNHRLFKNYLLNKSNTWHVGGKADLVFKPNDILDLQSFLKDLYQINKNIDIYWLGLGSNVLIRDGGIRGLVILTSINKNQGLNNLFILDNNNFNKYQFDNFCNFSDFSKFDYGHEFENLIICGAGVPCSKLAKFLVKNHFANGAFWAGIPGTMGGALAMNAGCYGDETWSYVKFVEVINKKGDIYLLSKKDFEIAYRKIKLRSNNILETNNNFGFLNAYLSLEKNYNIDGNLEIKKLLKTRTEAQPIGKLSCGSVFKNPANNYSAKLIQDSGLKGYKIGGAMVSDKHANFIINDKTATANDIETLINYIQQAVQEKTGITLEPEVKIIGEKLNEANKSGQTKEQSA